MAQAETRSRSPFRTPSTALYVIKIHTRFQFLASSSSFKALSALIALIALLALLALLAFAWKWRSGFPLEVFRSAMEVGASETMNNRTKIPETQSASAGGPPGPPKQTGHDSADDLRQEPHIDIPDPVVVGELASALHLKPFVVLGDIMKLRVFANMKETVDFETASKVAWLHGFFARRVG